MRRDDQIADSENTVFSRREGIDLDVLYCLSNEAMQGWFKIGFSSRTAGERARDLYDGYGDQFTTGVPLPFCVVREWELPRGRGEEVEQAVHRVLRERRPNPKREFFRFESGEHAIAEIERALAELDWYATAVADVKQKRAEAEQRATKQRAMRAAQRAADQQACPASTILSCQRQLS